MIRTRGGDFCYNNEEFQQMKNQLLEFKKVEQMVLFLGF
jgi:copper homeostasis protein CutC